MSRGGAVVARCPGPGPAHRQAAPLLAFNSSAANKEEVSQRECRFEGTAVISPGGLEIV